MNRTLLYTTAAMLIAASTLPARSSKHVDPSTALVNEARQTLRDIEQTVADAASAADREEMMSRENARSWQTHAACLNQIKADMNFIGREIKKLEAEQESLAHWERAALVRTVPLLKDAADNTQHAIEFLNGNMSHVWLKGTLHDYASQIAKDSDQVRDTLRTYLKLDNATRQAKDARELCRLSGGGLRVGDGALFARRWPDRLARGRAPEDKPAGVVAAGGKTFPPTPAHLHL